MKIKEVYIKNFKRFTDLQLTDIPIGTKLVLLIGTNGSGKSCVFDAFEYIASGTKEGSTIKPNNFYSDKKYYSKNNISPTEVFIETDKGNFRRFFDPNTSGHNSRYTGTEPYPEKKFYGRSAVRFQPRLEKTVIGTPISIELDTDRPLYYIDKDLRFENDIDLLLMEVVQKVFSDLNKQTVGKIDEIKIFLQKINDGLSRIFSHSSVSQLQLINFLTPAEGKPAQLIFKKGISEVTYDFLSSGEKEIINLLINLFTRSKIFTDSIYFIDEMDAHLNTTLQYQVIKEITEFWIPSNSQLWTASHSLGFIQYAKESDKAVIFDLDDLDFDRQQILFPEVKSKSELYEIAVGKEILPFLFKGFRTIFIENEDIRFYGLLKIKDTFFVKEKNKAGVFHKCTSGNVDGLIDRDFLTDEDIVELKRNYPNLFILTYYCVENYLFHPANMFEYFKNEGKEFDIDAYTHEIIEEKNKIKKSLKIRLATDRNSYPFFKEPAFIKSINAERFQPKGENFKQSMNISEFLDSDDFEKFYIYFSMKDYGKNISYRQNIDPTLLAKTKWFQTQIELTLQHN